MEFVCPFLSIRSHDPAYQYPLEANQSLIDEEIEISDDSNELPLFVKEETFLMPDDNKNLEFTTEDTEESSPFIIFEVENRSDVDHQSNDQESSTFVGKESSKKSKLDRRKIDLFDFESNRKNIQPIRIVNSSTLASNELNSSQNNLPNSSLDNEPPRSAKMFKISQSQPSSSVLSNSSAELNVSSSRSTESPNSQTVVNNHDFDFLKSLLPDLSKMNDFQKRQFKRRTLEIIDEILCDGPSSK